MKVQMCIFHVVIERQLGSIDSLTACFVQLSALRKIIPWSMVYGIVRKWPA